MKVAQPGDAEHPVVLAGEQRPDGGHRLRRRLDDPPMVPGGRPDRGDPAGRSADVWHAAIAATTSHRGAVGEQQQPAARRQRRQPIPPVLRDEGHHCPANDVTLAAGPSNQRVRLLPESGGGSCGGRHPLRLPRGDALGRQGPEPLPLLLRARARQGFRRRRGFSAQGRGSLYHCRRLVHETPRRKTRHTGQRPPLPRGKPAAQTMSNPL